MAYMEQYGKITSYSREDEITVTEEDVDKKIIECTGDASRERELQHWEERKQGFEEYNAFVKASHIHRCSNRVSMS